MLAMNTSECRITHRTPYELVFGQLSRHDQEFWEHIHNQIHAHSTNVHEMVDEEDIDNLFGETNYLECLVNKLDFFFEWTHFSFNNRR